MHSKYEKIIGKIDDLREVRRDLVKKRQTISNIKYSKASKYINNFEQKFLEELFFLMYNFSFTNEIKKDNTFWKPKKLRLNKSKDKRRFEIECFQGKNTTYIYHDIDFLRTEKDKSKEIKDIIFELDSIINKEKKEIKKDENKILYKIDIEDNSNTSDLKQITLKESEIRSSKKKRKKIDKVFSNKEDYYKYTILKKIGKESYKFGKNINIYKVKRSPYWWVRITFERGSRKNIEKRCSSITTDLQKALAFAIEKEFKLAPQYCDRRGGVYFCSNEIITKYYQCDIYKIGKTDVLPYQREASLSTSLPVPYIVNLVILTDYSKELEYDIQKKLSQKSIAKEFFKISQKDYEKFIKDEYRAIELTNEELQDKLLHHYSEDGYKKIIEYYKEKKIPKFYWVDYIEYYNKKAKL